MPYILALDQGTTSSRAIVFDHDAAIVAVSQREFPQIFPQARLGRARSRTRSGRRRSPSASEALGRAGLRPRDIAAIGITNQRETTVVWDRETGAPVHNAIVWQDRRTADFCDRLKRGGPRRLHPRTHRARDRRLLFREQGGVDSRQRPWCAGQSGGRQAGVRDHRQLAGLAADQRLDSCHRRDQRVADDAVQHPHAEMGRRAAEAPPRSGQPAAGGPAVERGLRTGLDDARRRRGADRRDRRRSAGRALRPDVRLPGHGEEHLRHRLLPAAEHRRAPGRVAQSTAHDGGLGGRRQDRATRSRAASSSAARWSNGCATGWA